jgi:hypothetical protein
MGFSYQRVPDSSSIPNADMQRADKAFIETVTEKCLVLVIRLPKPQIREDHEDVNPNDPQKS